MSGDRAGDHGVEGRALVGRYETRETVEVLLYRSRSGCQWDSSRTPGNFEPSASPTWPPARASPSPSSPWPGYSPAASASCPSPAPAAPAAKRNLPRPRAGLHRTGSRQAGSPDGPSPMIPLIAFFSFGRSLKGTSLNASASGIRSRYAMSQTYMKRSGTLVQMM